MRKWIDAFEDLGKKLGDYLSENANSQVIIDELIEKVVVFNDDRIEITMNCSDVIAQYNNLLEGEDETDCHILKTVFS